MKRVLIWSPIVLLIIFVSISSTSLGVVSFRPETALPSSEALLSETENAYNPIPNPEGTLIAYVRTGWFRKGGSGGFGRSNLKSEIKVMDVNGNILTEKPIADAFLSSWTDDGKNLVCYKNGKYFIVTPEGKGLIEGEIPTDNNFDDSSERVAYLSSKNSILWLQNQFTNTKTEERPNGSTYTSRDFVRAVIQSSKGEIAQFKPAFVRDAIIIPSPNERYLALIGANSKGGNRPLWIYNRENKSWTDLGEITIHPDEDWEYIKPMWNPWFADSSKLTFISDSGIVIYSPDGKSKQIISQPKEPAGLPAASPDGKLIAFATFEPRPKKRSNDLKFWGGSTIWVTSTVPNSKALPLTEKNSDTTYTLRWINNHQIVFDRLADEDLYSRTRLWKVGVAQ